MVNDVSNVRRSVLGEEQERALELMLLGRNVFLTGAAGTGKSAVVREFQRRYKGRLACLAPTGLAARAIDGETVHRFFQFFNDATLEDSFIASGFYRKCRLVDAILIDEVSMLRADVFQAIDGKLRQATGLSHVPFGGKQIIVVGDFFQLGPVREDAGVEAFLLTRFSGVHAFNAEAWNDARFVIVSLNRVYRQRDQETMATLNAIRTGDLFCPSLTRHDGSPSSYVDLLNAQCYRPDANDPRAITLCATRYVTGAINNQAVERLRSAMVVYRGDVDGEFPPEDLPTDNELTVKLGERVMVLANDPDGAYANGDIGVVVAMNEPRREVAVCLERGNRLVTVGRYRWGNLAYESCDGEQTLRRRPIGWFHQLPLAPAYAITIHKSQGQTFDAVRLELDVNGCFAPGQLYTALSRCVTLRSLYLNRPIQMRDCVVDPAVLEFERRSSSERCVSFV